MEAGYRLEIRYTSTRGTARFSWSVGLHGTMRLRAATATFHSQYSDVSCVSAIWAATLGAEPASVAGNGCQHSNQFRRHPGNYRGSLLGSFTRAGKGGRRARVAVNLGSCSPMLGFYGQQQSVCCCRCASIAGRSGENSVFNASAVSCRCKFAMSGNSAHRRDRCLSQVAFVWPARIPGFAGTAAPAVANYCGVRAAFEHCLSLARDGLQQTAERLFFETTLSVAVFRTCTCAGSQFRHGQLRWRNHVSVQKRRCNGPVQMCLQRVAAIKESQTRRVTAKG